MPYAVNYSLRQGRHGNGIAVRVLADEQIVGKFEGMVLICDTIDDKWAEAFVRMHIDSVELLSLQGIVLQCAVIGDASAAYPGTPCGILIFNMFLYIHGVKDINNINNKQINHKTFFLLVIY